MKLLSFRYDDVNSNILSLYRALIGQKDFIWWKDLLYVGFSSMEVENWFAKSITCKVGTIK